MLILNDSKQQFTDDLVAACREYDELQDRFNFDRGNNLNRVPQGKYDPGYSEQMKYISGVKLAEWLENELPQLKKRAELLGLDFTLEYKHAMELLRRKKKEES